MTVSYEPVLLRNVGVERSQTLAVYRKRGGYATAAKALKAMTPVEVREEVERASLRGRGGAGFPAGVKWGFLPEDRKITYLCVNADESEPATFSNRVLMENDPHQLLEGILLAGYATRTTVAYIYMRAEFCEAFHILQRALDEAYADGLFGRHILGSDFSMECYIHRGGGAYICGEETGLIESLEGKRGQPRIKPPFPAIEGLFRKPTVVNNVETLCNVVHILNRGAEWFTSIGPEGSHGPKLFCVSGPVNRPGCFEGPMTITVEELIEGDAFAQGMQAGRTVKGVFPGGISMGILSADELGCKLDFDDVRNYGLLGLGTAAATVIPDGTDMRSVLLNITRFFAHESCGQCTQCRDGTGWMYRIARRIARGAGRTEDLDLILELTRNMGMMPGLSICGLADGAAFPIRTIVEKYRDEFEAHIRDQASNAVELALSVVN